MLHCIDDVFSFYPTSLTQRIENPIGIIIQLQRRVESKVVSISQIGGSILNSNTITHHRNAIVIDDRSQSMCNSLEISNELGG